MSCCGGGSGVTGLCGLCGCTPCTCVYQNIIQTGGGGTTPTAGQCVNLSGVCVLDAYNSNTMYFRGIDTTNAAILSIALNATNHTIELTVNVNALASALPQATTTQAGVGETATDAEAQAKASTTVFVTPSNFAAMDASTTFAGLIEIATNAEAITGTSATLALTPASFTAAMAANYGTTAIFADAVALAGGTPAFIGQFAAEQDIFQAFLGTATTPGAWAPILTFGTNNTVTSNTTITFNNNFTWDGLGIGSILFSGLNFSVVTGSSVTIDTGCLFTFNNGSILTINGSTVSANSVLTTNGTPGQVSSALINTFVSTANVQTGYAITNPATIRSYDTATVTLQQLAQALGTLITDLKAAKLPAT